MRPVLLLPAFVLIAASCTSKPRRAPPPQWAFPPAQQQAPNYQLPWAAPAGSATAAQPVASASTGPAPSPAPAADTSRCLGEAGTKEDCQGALAALAKAGTPTGTYDVYKRACEKKAKLLGCGAFKSTAITDADKPNMELLMLCESGAATACEDVKTKTAPLQAWLSTLKTDLCKKGESALCEDFRKCKKPAKWGCSAVTGAADRQACGCQSTCAGTLTVGEGPRKWSDGSTRATYTCSEAKP